MVLTNRRRRLSLTLWLCGAQISTSSSSSVLAFQTTTSTTTTTTTTTTPAVFIRQDTHDGIQGRFGRHVLSTTSNIHVNSESSSTGRIRDIRFALPLLEHGYPPAVQDYEDNVPKPLLLYLPGFDGTFMAPFLQLPELSTTFHVECLTMTMNDRSTYKELKTSVVEYIRHYVQTQDEMYQRQREEEAEEAESLKYDQEPAVAVETKRKFTFAKLKSATPTVKRSNKRKHHHVGRHVYLCGESFGGILASDVALTLLEEDFDNNINNKNKNDFYLKGMTLINAATCYDRSKLASMGSDVAHHYPKLLYPLGLARLIPLFTDEYSWQQLWMILTAQALPSVIDTAQRESFMGRIAFCIPSLLQYMSQETLKWRLQEWLEQGCATMESRLDVFATEQKKFKHFRVLIVAGEKDLCLPSIGEAERLASIFQQSHVFVVEGAGHASTCGSRVDLAALMRQRFPELLVLNESTRADRNSIVSANGVDSQGRGKIGRGRSQLRTAMKPVAAQGTGVHLGMEPRYDGRDDIGLSPLKYWTKNNYRKVDMNKVKNHH